MTRVLVVSDDQDLPAQDGGDGPATLPATLHTWLESGPYDIDALILDLDGPDAARAAVGEVRKRGLAVPIILVADDAPGWDAPDLVSLSRCAVLPSPVDPQALRDAVNSFQGDSIGGAVAADSFGNVLGPALSLEERVTEYRVVRRNRRESNRDKRMPTTDSLLATPSGGDQSGTDATAQARDGPPPAPIEAAAPASIPAEETGPLPISALALVRALIGRVSELDGVAATSDVIVKGAVERAGADAGVMLLPDQSRWRVAGGTGLRPVETRFELTEDSWLVKEIALAAKGMIVEDTDIARSRLRGAPLASWRHLMAAPVTGTGAVVLLARKNDPPFDEAVPARACRGCRRSGTADQCSSRGPKLRATPRRFPRPGLIASLTR